MNIETKIDMSQILCPFLFQIEGKNISSDQEVYLFGTCHDLKIDQYPEKVLALIKKCDLLVSEFLIRLVAVQDCQLANRQEFVKVRGVIQQKFINFDENWFRENLKKLNFPDIDVWINKLSQKAEEIKRDKEVWLQALEKMPGNVGDKIQKHIDLYGLKIQDLDPFFVEEILDHIITTKNYDSHTGEAVIVRNFKERNCPLVELDDEDSIELVFLESFVAYIEDYSMEDSLNSIIEYLNEIDNDSEDNVEETDYSYMLKTQSNFNLQEFKEKNEERLSTIYRNHHWIPKILSAISQKKPTAIIVGFAHLQGGSGMIQSLEQLGYRVRHFKGNQ